MLIIIQHCVIMLNKVITLLAYFANFTSNKGQMNVYLLLYFLFQKCAEEVVVDTGSFKKGLLWQQRDKLFSRWKERYFFLTKDYFHCFKKATSRITEMGGFIFKVTFLNTFTSIPVGQGKLIEL